MKEKWEELWERFINDSSAGSKCDKCESTKVEFSYQAFKYDKDEDTGDEVSEYVERHLCKVCYEEDVDAAWDRVDGR